MDDQESVMLLAWREHMLVEHGCEVEEARGLAELGIDWHELRRLLDMGCDRETALRILR